MFSIINLRLLWIENLIGVEWSEHRWEQNLGLFGKDEEFKVAYCMARLDAIEEYLKIRKESVMDSDIDVRLSELRI